jgi:hypothetical protein
MLNDECGSQCGAFGEIVHVKSHKYLALIVKNAETGMIRRPIERLLLTMFV